MQPVMVDRWGVDPATKANQITREQKRELVRLCKHWRVSVDARGDLAHAVITAGGVPVREVDPKTMQSKRPQAFILRARCWMWTPIPAAITCRSLSARHRALPIICDRQKGKPSAWTPKITPISL